MVLTGLIGRYLLRFVPRTATGRQLDELGFTDEIMSLIDQVHGEALHEPDAVRAMQSLSTNCMSAEYHRPLATCASIWPSADDL